ncbi:MAG TPA: ribosome maturation factor RimP [Actinomycetales bacterium]|nr:ribosome maturation factor RimP [Actinomycetales bacterium]
MPAHRQPGATPTEVLRQTLSAALAESGISVEDVTVTPAGSRRVLRVVVDRADETGPSLSLDDVAEASRAASDALDASDVMGGAPYVLEVSTPGVDRPLTERRQFVRNLRRLVRVTLDDGTAVEGRVQSADESLVLTVAGPTKGMTATKALEWAQVVRGQVQVEFNHDGEGG